MALIKCEECGNKVSSKAYSCPNCGNPMVNYEKIINNSNKGKTSNNDNYTALKVISFLFPLIGLIIYAINIGKNDKLSKISVKWAFFGMVAIGLLMLLLIEGLEAFFVILSWIVVFIIIYFIVGKFVK